MDNLETILENKRKEVKDYKETHGDHLYTGEGRERPSFKNAVALADQLSVIAEIKRMSPSQGAMNMKDDPLDIARLYEQTGASAVSVLTDEKFFGGSFDFLKAISEELKIPLLCKDFIIDRIQIDLAKLSGASAVLLITEALDDHALEDLYRYAYSIGLDCLVEAHYPENIRRASELKAEIIGINNRNLFTFEESLNHSIEQAHLLPEASVKLSLSALRSREDMVRLAEANFDGILAGTVLMKAFNKKAALNSFLGVSKPQKTMAQ
jgi:indole-3-glycerol phosphate synthase